MNVKSTDSKLFEYTCDWNIFFGYLKKFMSFNRMNSGNYEFKFKNNTYFEKEKILRENSVSDTKKVLRNRAVETGLQFNENPS